MRALQKKETVDSYQIVKKNPICVSWIDSALSKHFDADNTNWNKMKEKKY